MSTPRDVPTLLSTSAPLTFKVVRSAQTEYPAPSVLEAVNNILEPINARNGATVQVAYPGMLTSDILAVAWLGSNPAGRWESEQKPGSAFGSVDFSVPASVVAASQGTVVQVLYAVVQAGKAGVPSLPLDLTVGELAQADLPMPAITQANPITRTLDLNSFAGNASATVVAWPLIATGQRFWVWIDGTLENGSAHRFYAASAQAVTEAQVGQGLDVAVLRTELEKFRHASVVSVTVSVAFDGASNEASVRAFPVATYTLEKLIAVTPTIDSVMDDKGKIVPPDGSTVSTTLTLSGQASAGQKVEILDGDTVLKTETVGAIGEWTSTLTGLAAKTYTLKARGLYGANPESEAWGLTVQTHVCDDLSTAPLGRYPDRQLRQLTSMLNCTPDFGGAGRSAQAQVVQVGNNRELQWLYTLGGAGGYSDLRLGLRDLDYPLKSPLTVTLEFYVTQSNATQVQLVANYYLAGEQHAEVRASVGARTIAVTVPAEAVPSPIWSPQVGGIRLYLGEATGRSLSALIHLKSVCLSQ
ncbi:hypothetical protein VA602_02340 [Pseudomonas sp. MH2]|uniref:Ig-like domain (Group 3) n=1 Tax=Pseudomonas machongensis TaxID=3110229 RepID=A0ABU5V9Y1_9PSED|nr:hypothetical protein [Pseudomonas sp. MH2]MEA5670174.1 hypothetical protein [Pseudomonas sp. MH2]